MRKTILHFLPVLFISALPFSVMVSQVSNPDAVKAMISRYKLQDRGPYLDIRWFCPDGTTRAARDPCPNKPGNQRARYRDEVNALAQKEHIFLGQILTMTPNTEFWDEANGQSRLIQYQIEQYLRSIDNGWINRQAQFYRGAMQVEDENSWGVDFYEWLLTDADKVKSKYFLIRQSAKDIPHAAESNNAQLVRSLSKEISDDFSAFQDLRIKIHGSPDESDIKQVRDFQVANKEKIPAALTPKFDQLLDGLGQLYRPFNVSDFDRYHRKLPDEAAGTLRFFTNWYPVTTSVASKCEFISSIALQLRQQVIRPMRSEARLAIIDISNKLEVELNKEVSDWNPASLKEQLRQVRCLSEAATAFGFLELWEWEEIKMRMAVQNTDAITLQLLSDHSESGRRVAEWGAGMVRANYMSVLNIYEDFEPLATGFFDDRVRSSVLLHLGRAVTRLGDVFSDKAGFSNNVMSISGQSSIRGLNPGFTVGELVVVSESPENVTLSPDKIYVFNEAPENLKPVAGIATVSEGNLVSHVQLLARNLGIPNAVVSEENMRDLNTYNGKEVFYAVSNKGTVIMKPVSKMTPRESELFKQKKRSEEKISVPIERIVLDNPRILNLRAVNATASGKTCGPKAANLGQLKQMFPENVVEGLVLPFAVFRQHMEQIITGYDYSYWEMMNWIFNTGEGLRQRGEADADVEVFVLQELACMRELIGKMPLLPTFREELRQQFVAVFGQPLGRVPVFVRSDTNMEDLKDFTGAGLNLTVFNVLNEEKIFQGIRDVWASPYTERSYKWRQRYLHNPENVFPSILIIPSINADHSGVLITKGVTTGRDEDITVAFSRGVGGAVDGQAAESWLLGDDCYDRLIAPAREPTYMSIPATGGSVRVRTTFEKPILSTQNLAMLRILAARILAELPGAPGINSRGPFDMELGFSDNKMWLFQVRPFVENKQATASEYLQQITPVFKGERTIALNMKL